MSLVFVMRHISADCYTTVRGGSCPRPVGCACGSQGYISYKVKAEYGSLCEIKGILDRQFFAGVVCTWLQADPVEPQLPYGYGRRYCAAFHDTALLNSARERHMPPTHLQH